MYLLNNNPADDESRVDDIAKKDRLDVSYEDTDRSLIMDPLRSGAGWAPRTSVC